MNQKIIRKVKWFWPWQDDQEEAWLEQMSQQGLHLKRAHLLGQYDFLPGQPQDYVYRLDFQDALKRNQKDDYLLLFAEAGWEHLGEMGGWQYFRKLAQPGEEAEIFTDPDTKIQKYKRHLTYMGCIFASFVMLFIGSIDYWQEWMRCLYGIILLSSYIFAMVVSLKIMKRIKELKAL